MSAQVVFAPVVLELMNLGFNQVHRADSASELANGDLNRSIWKGEDFWIWRRRPRRLVHNGERR